MFKHFLDQLATRRVLLPLGALILYTSGTSIYFDPDPIAVMVVLGNMIATLVFGFLLASFQNKLEKSFVPGRTEYLVEPLRTGESLIGNLNQFPDGCWQAHAIYQCQENLQTSGDLIHFYHQQITGDDWDYIYIPPEMVRSRNYSWSLSVLRNTNFREYAFNFRYRDFDNRYRFRFEENKIFFDKKVAGQWVNNIASIPFQMSLGKWYDLRIDAFETLFRCYVDQILMLECSDTDIADGSISIILWEDDSSTRIDAEIRDQQLFVLDLPVNAEGETVDILSEMTRTE